MLERGSDGDPERLDFINDFLESYGDLDTFAVLNYLNFKVHECLYIPSLSIQALENSSEVIHMVGAVQKCKLHIIHMHCLLSSILVHVYKLSSVYYMIM